LELRVEQIAEILQSGRKLQAEAPGANVYYQYTLLTSRIVWVDETFSIICFAGRQQRGSLTEYQLWSAQYHTYDYTSYFSKGGWILVKFHAFTNMWTARPNAPSAASSIVSLKPG
jgi:hypothetical protein